MPKRSPFLSLDQQAAALAARFSNAQALRVLSYGRAGAGGTCFLKTLCHIINSVETTPQFRALYHRSCNSMGQYVPIPRAASADLIALDDFEIGYPAYLQEGGGLVTADADPSHLIAHTGRDDREAALYAWRRFIGTEPHLILHIESQLHVSLYTRFGAGQDAA